MPRSITLTCAAALTAATLALAGCAGADNQTAADTSGGLAEMEPIVIKWADIAPEGSPTAVAAQAFADEVEKETDGKITFETYFSASLLPPPEQVSGLQSGIAEGGQIIVSLYPDDLPISSWLLKMAPLAPEAFPSGGLAATLAADALYASNEELIAEYESHNLKVLSVSNSNQTTDLLCTKPLGTLAEAAGTRTRTVDSIITGEIQALDMVPVPLASAETFEGLQRGVVDCVAQGLLGFTTNGTWEIANQYMPTDMSGIPGQLSVINLDTWNSLPAEAQQIIEDASRTFLGTEMNQAYVQYAKFGLQGPSEHGIEVLDPTEYNVALKAYQDELFTSILDSAPEGMNDPQAFADSYEALLAEKEQVADDYLEGQGVTSAVRGAGNTIELYTSVDGLDVLPLLRGE